MLDKTLQKAIKSYALADNLSKMLHTDSFEVVKDFVVDTIANEFVDVTNENNAIVNTLQCIINDPFTIIYTVTADEFLSLFESLKTGEVPF